MKLIERKGRQLTVWKYLTGAEREDKSQMKEETKTVLRNIPRYIYTWLVS